MKDYYKTLGIEKNATKDEIKKAFHKMAHTHHPDKNGGDDAKFKEANEAYQILSDDKKKQQYDTYGSADFSSAGGGQGGGYGGGFQNGGFDINFEDLGGFGDMFGDIFGGSRQSRSRTAKGRDLETEIRISFKESIFGVEHKISIRHAATCASCVGSGAEGSKTKTCGTCHGAGSVQKVQRTFMGQFAVQAVCDACSGVGTIPEKACSHCRGKGVEEKKEEVSFAIPAGVSHGDTMRIRGKGDAVKGGTPGDLYVHIRVGSHSAIRRAGQNLELDLPISVIAAVLGKTYKAETLDGEKECTVPAGFQVGDRIVLRGFGVPGARGRGDCIVYPKIQIPKKLSKAERELYEKLENIQ